MPPTYGFVGDVQPTFDEHLLNVTKTQREPAYSHIELVMMAGGKRRRLNESWRIGRR
jgi:hypothetical protein